MTDLPRGSDETGPRSGFDIFMLGGFEALTTALRRGQRIRDVEELARLSARYRSFCEALDMRLKVHGMGDLLEGEDDAS